MFQPADRALSGIFHGHGILAPHFQRTAIHHQLTNRSATGGREQVNFVTTFLADGSLFYYVTVVPADESNSPPVSSHDS